LGFQELRATDFEALEDALDTLSMDKKILVEKELDDLKEEMAEYQEVSGFVFTIRHFLNEVCMCVFPVRHFLNELSIYVFPVRHFVNEVSRCVLMSRGSRHFGKITGRDSRPQFPLPPLGSLTSWWTWRQLVVKSGNI